MTEDVKAAALTPKTLGPLLRRCTDDSSRRVGGRGRPHAQPAWMTHRYPGQHPKKRPHPDASWGSFHIGGHRFTCFATNTLAVSSPTSNYARADAACCEAYIRRWRWNLSSAREY